MIHRFASIKKKIRLEYYHLYLPVFCQSVPGCSGEYIFIIEEGTTQHFSIRGFHVKHILTLMSFYNENQVTSNKQRMSNLLKAICQIHKLHWWFFCSQVIRNAVVVNLTSNIYLIRKVPKNQSSKLFWKIAAFKTWTAEKLTYVNMIQFLF